MTRDGAGDDILRALERELLKRGKTLQEWAEEALTLPFEEPITVIGNWRDRDGVEVDRHERDKNGRVRVVPNLELPEFSRHWLEREKTHNLTLWLVKQLDAGRCVIVKHEDRGQLRATTPEGRWGEDRLELARLYAECAHLCGTFQTALCVCGHALQLHLGQSNILRCSGYAGDTNRCDCERFYWENAP